jgi:hypothetical protein
MSILSGQEPPKNQKGHGRRAAIIKTGPTENYVSKISNF